MKRNPVILAAAISAIFSPLSSEEEITVNDKKKPNTLTLSEASRLALDYAIELRLAKDDIDEIRGVKTQFKSHRNPVVSYSVEDVFGNKDWKGWKSAESRYQIDQLVEIGGKRGYRIQYASYLESAAKATYEARKLFLFNKLSKAFIDVAASEEKYKLLKQGRYCADQEFQKATLKNLEGKGSTMQQNKAEIFLSTIKLQLERARIEVLKAKEKLSLLWGTCSPDFENVEYPFYELEPPSDFNIFKANLSCHPVLIRTQWEVLAARENLNLEKAERVPDLTVMMGYKMERHSNRQGMMFGAAIPIPVFNHNSGNIQKATAVLNKTFDLYQGRLQLLEHKLSSTFRDFNLAYNEAKMLREQVLVAAEESCEHAHKGFLAGKFEYLEILDAKKTQLEIKEKYIQALQTYHQCKTDIEYLFSQEIEL